PEPVDALPRPLDVDRVDLVHRHAVREQGDLELGRDAAAEVERPPALELLAVPDLGPRAGVLPGRKRLRVVNDVEGVDLVADGVTALERLRNVAELRLVELAVVDRVEQ